MISIAAMSFRAYLFCCLLLLHANATKYISGGTEMMGNREKRGVWSITEALRYVYRTCQMHTVTL